MKKGIKHILRKFILIIMILKLVFAESAKAQIFTRPLPRKWIPKYTCQVRQTWFMTGSLLPGNKSKQQIFEALIGKGYDNIFYPVLAVDTLFSSMEKLEIPKGIHIYITSFIEAYHEQLPTATNKENEILLVFAPSDANDKHSQDRGDYYVIANDEAGTKKCFEIKKETLEKWAEHYVEYIVGTTDGLATTVDSKASENQLYGKPSDSRCVFYPYDDIKEFLSNDKHGERRYQTRKFDKNITGIQVDFVAYPNSGRETVYGGDNKFRYRLLLQFEYTEKVGTNSTDEVFYIDDERNFFRRRKKAEAIDKKRNSLSTQKWEDRKSEIRIKGFDNGTLCPPCENCPAGYNCTDRN